MGNLGCPTSTWNQSPTRSPLSATQNPSFFQPQSIQHHREPSLSSQTGKTSSHFDQLYGPTTGTTHYEQHSKYASRDLCNYHKPSRYYSKIENINSTKKKKNQTHNFNPPDWEQESWKPTIKCRSPPIEWRHRTTHRRYAVTFAPTMPLHGFRDMTHQVRSLPSSAVDSHCRRAQPSLRRRLQRCFVLCFAASSLLVSLCFSSFGV